MIGFAKGPSDDLIAPTGVTSPTIAASPTRSRSPPRFNLRTRETPRERDRETDRLQEPGPRKSGIAGRWNDRGFGFIVPDDGGDEVFCHFSSIQDGNALREGDRVEYEGRYDSRKGKHRAENITGGITDEGKAIATDNGTDKSEKENNVCYDYQKGRCKRGLACKFKHEGPVEVEEVDPWKPRNAPKQPAMTPMGMLHGGALPMAGLAQGMIPMMPFQTPATLQELQLQAQIQAALQGQMRFQQVPMVAPMLSQPLRGGTVLPQLKSATAKVAPRAPQMTSRPSFSRAPVEAPAFTKGPSDTLETATQQQPVQQPAMQQPQSMAVNAMVGGTAPSSSGLDPSNKGYQMLVRQGWHQNATAEFSVCKNDEKDAANKIDQINAYNRAQAPAAAQPTAPVTEPLPPPPLNFVGTYQYLI